MNQKVNETQHQSLKTTPFSELPLGSIKPLGWVKDQLEIQAEGMTGHLDEHWEDVGPDSGWLGGSGESWERGPYYLDGLLPLAYLLDDQTLINKVQPWIEWTLASQQEDGQFGPTTNDDWWPRMVMAKVLIQYEEATNDDRVIPFLSNYFRYQWNHLKKRPLSGWGAARGGENILCIYWLYARTKESFLLELVDLIHQQTLDWTGIYTQFPFSRYQTQFDHRVHVVNVAMGLKEPALYYRRSGETIHRDAAKKGIESLMTHHGQVQGMFSGDEWLAGTHPSQGVELCAVVEYMFSLEQLIQVFGDGCYGDILEKVAFNALPATISADWHGHQYDQQVNQVMCTLAKRNWTENGDDANLFGLEPHFGCCTSNMHQGWPKFASRLWMATEDRGLAAVSYAPCEVKAVVSDQVRSVLRVNTAYPFRDEIQIDVELDSVAQFPIKLRIPAWCSNPTVRINGQNYDVNVQQGYATINREWKNGDRLVLTLPMEVQIEPRANLAVGVGRGPLVYALPIGERWQKLRGEDPYPDWEIYPQTPWNYGLYLKHGQSTDSFQIHTKELPRQPFEAEHAPVSLKVSAKKVPTWLLDKNSAGAPPISPVQTNEQEEEIELVPYGSAKLRIAEFPTCE